MPIRLLAYALASSVLLQAQIAVTLEPLNPVLQAGESLAFRARVLKASRAECHWRVAGTGGRITQDGVFTGPPGYYRVRATSAADPSAFAETSLAVLPDSAALKIVSEIRGKETFAPGWSETLPFRDIDGQGRFGDPRAAVTEFPMPEESIFHTVGYGLKVPLPLPRMGVLPDFQLLSCLESGEPVRQEVSGKFYALIQARGPVSGVLLESLNRGERGSWLSRTQKLDIRVRGLLPFAGNAVAGPGDADGKGLASRFRRPAGMAVLDSGILVVADIETHVLRMVLPDGDVTTLLGRPGEYGHRDGCQEGARFRYPTFVAACPAVKPAALGLGSPSFLVADSGNHVIRAVDSLGRVSTLAGVPGRRGHKDSDDPRQALFDDPRGLGVDEGGNVYVADRGNHVLRRISPQGAVTTLAGIPGQPGWRDGAEGAQFSGLQDLAVVRAGVHAAHPMIYVVDRHCVRKVAPTGDVATLCGDPGVPGFSPGPGSARMLAGVPCLDDPCGLASAGGDLFLADRNNHAVQVLRPEPDGKVRLATLAGDRKVAATRPGLLRFGIEGPLGEDFGALGSPQGVAAGPGKKLYVSAGPCILQCSEIMPPPFMTGPELLLQPGGRVVPDLDLAVDFLGPRFLAEAYGEEDSSEPVPYFWTLDFLDPRTGQAVAAQLKGEVRSRVQGSARVAFSDRGEVDVHLTCVTAEGYPMKSIVRIRVE